MFNIRCAEVYANQLHNQKTLMKRLEALTLTPADAFCVYNNAFFCCYTNQFLPGAFRTAVAHYCAIKRFEFEEIESIAVCDLLQCHKTKVVKAVWVQKLIEWN